MTRPRARDLGIVVGWHPPGQFNAITDVAGVRVGHSTVLKPPDVRTGVTIVQPRSGNVAEAPVFAGLHRLNGFGELTGSWWIQESGQLASPIALTNTYSVGAVHAALIAHSLEHYPNGTWDLPVVGETSDSRLNDIAAMVIGQTEVDAALKDAHPGPVTEGSVGGGAGMICHGFKGGIGTASRRPATTDWTVGVLVQANHGRRERFSVNGSPVGHHIGSDVVPEPTRAPAGREGSIITIVATDAPLLPHQLTRLAQRASFGIARTGGTGEGSSGDIILAFSSAELGTGPVHMVEMLDYEELDPLTDAVIEATEEAILNAMLAAETVSGFRGVTVHALPPEQLRALLGLG